MTSLSAQSPDGIFDCVNVDVFTALGSYHFSKSAKRHIEHFAPISITKPYSVDLYPSISGRIPALAFCSAPPNIAGFVVSVIVNSINRMFFRGSVANVIKKIHKAFAPSLADFNSTPSIPWIFTVHRIEAPLLDVAPDDILRAADKTVQAPPRRSIDTQRLGGNFTLKTAATECGLSDIGRRHYDGSTAVAATFPHSVPRLRCFCSTQHNKTAMALAGKIKRFGHLYLLRSDNRTDTVLGMVSQW